MHINNLDATASQSLTEKSTELKLLDLLMSDVRSAERSIVLNVLHSYYSDLLASKSASFAEGSANIKLLNSSVSDVRSTERSIELNILHSYHSDPLALSFAEKSKNSKQLNLSMSDVPDRFKRDTFKSFGSINISIAVIRFGKIRKLDTTYKFGKFDI